MDRYKISARDIASIGMMTATLEVAKMSLSFLPNIEIISLLIIVYTLYFERQIIYAIFAFIIMEGLIYGFGMWWIMYAYTWPLLALITYLLRKKKSLVLYAAVSLIYGLMYGGLCSLTYIFFGGVRTAIAWWIAGIPYDIIHGVGNFIICIVLYTPLTRALDRIKRNQEDRTDLSD